MPISKIYNCDRMDFLSKFPDKYFDLIIDDPPYGIGEDGSKNNSRNKIAIAKSYVAYSGMTLMHPRKNISKSLLGFQRIKLFGEQTTL